MFKKILIVCIGNICRSPTAEHLLDAALTSSGITVSSAGLAALRDHPLEPTAGQVLQEHGHVPRAHKARQLSVEAVSEADLILGKHRGGPTSTITVAHQLHYSRFVDMARGL